MTDTNTNNDEKIPMNQDMVKADLSEADAVNAEVDLDDSKAKFLNGGKGVDDSQVVVEVRSADSGNASFTGLGKEELMVYAKDPFWVRLRIILFVLFWIGWITMLVAAIVIIVMAPRCPHRPDLKWYHKEVVYQAVPESFQDTDGDGVGDLAGIKSHLKYFKDLAVGAVSLGAVYKKDSFGAVVDHRDVNAKFGTLEEFEGFLKSQKNTGIKVILDFIPNYTSRNHTWFKKSVASEGKYKDYYVWTNKTNNWKSVLGGSAWTQDPKRKEYFLHQRSPDFPELNLHNQDVREELKGILKFWLERGVAGFNLVDAELLVENENMTDEKELIPGGNGYDSVSHTETKNYPGTLEVIAEWRDLLDGYSDKPGRERFLFATLAGEDVNQTLAYYGTSEAKGLNIIAGLGLAKEFGKNCDADCVKTIIDKEVTESKQEQWHGWMLGNKDTSRISARMSKGETIAHVLQLLLPGTAFNYYGDEIGMKDGNLAQVNLDDITSDVTEQERLKYRTPMQWNTSEHAGFTFKKSKPWLPVNQKFVENNVAAENAVLGKYTVYNIVKDLIALRKKESMQWGKLTSGVIRDIFWFVRKAEGFPGYLVVINFGSGPVTHRYYGEGLTSKKGKVVFHTQRGKLGSEADLKSEFIILDGGHAFVLELSM